MARTPDVSYITGFSEVVYHEFQQMTSKLFPFVELTEMKASKKAVEGLGAVEAKEINGRYQSVVFDDIAHLRRKLPRRRFSVDLPIDANDARAMLMDQPTEYAKAIVKALQRKMDRVIYDALFADIYTGEDFENVVTFEQDGGLTVDATSGLTWEKTLEITQNFIDGDVDVDNNQFALIGTGDEMVALMKETELTSRDYTSQFAVEKGFLNRAGMFDCVWFSSNAKDPIIKLNAGGKRECAAIVKGGIILGVNKQVGIEIKDRPDLYETKQVSAIMSIGAVRRQGKVVQKVTTTP